MGLNTLCIMGMKITNGLGCWDSKNLQCFFSKSKILHKYLVVSGGALLSATSLNSAFFKPFYMVFSL